MVSQWVMVFTFSGSGEMDNGWNVTVSYELDNNDDMVAGLQFDDHRNIKNRY